MSDEPTKDQIEALDAIALDAIEEYERGDTVSLEEFRRDVSDIDPSDFFEVKLGIDLRPNGWYSILHEVDGDIWAMPVWWDGDACYSWQEAHDLGLAGEK